MSFFYLFIYFIVVANIFFFQIDRLEPSFTDSVIRFRFRFRIPCFSAAARRAHSRLFTEVVFIVFQFIAGAKVYAGSSLSHTRIQRSESWAELSLEKVTHVALHFLWLVNSTQHTCSGTCSADQFSRSCI